MSISQFSRAAVIVALSASCAGAAAADCPQKKIEALVGRMIIAGFFGQQASEPGYQQVLTDLENGTVGGVLILGRNVGSREHLQLMMNRISACKCEQKPFVTIDEEGGAIERLGPNIGSENTPSASQVARGSIAAARSVYGKVAEKLSSLGFNANLGPVVDIDRNPQNPVIGRLGRSYGSDADTVVKYATAFIEEHRKRHIVTVLKHFPGHGSSSSDSHLGVADVTSSWTPEELTPFKRLIDAGLVDAIMVGHLANFARWGGIATQSPASAISHMLREDLAFDGVVLTDDLAMRAVSDGKAATLAAAVEAVKAGADMLVVGRLADDEQAADVGSEVNREITSKVCTGEIDINAIQRSVDRIQKLGLR